MAETFEGDDANLRAKDGLSRLRFLHKAMYANYDESQPSSNVHFMIAGRPNPSLMIDICPTTASFPELKVPLRPTPNPSRRALCRRSGIDELVVSVPRCTSGR